MPLACAANKGHMDILNYLLRQNVNVNGNSQVSIQLLSLFILILTIFTLHYS